MNFTIPVCFSAFEGMPMDVARRIRAGVPATLVDEIAAFLGLRLEGLAAHLGFSVDRIIDLATRGDNLDSWEAGRLYWVAAVFFETQTALQSESGSAEWLRERVPALGNVAPLSLLDTPPGFQLVMTTLAQIQYSVYT